MNWLSKHLHSLIHAAADAIEQHPDKVIAGLRFVAGVVTKLAPGAGTVVAVVEGVVEKTI